MFSLTHLFSGAFFFQFFVHSKYLQCLPVGSLLCHITYRNVQLAIAPFLDYCYYFLCSENAIQEVCMFSSGNSCLLLFFSGSFKIYGLKPKSLIYSEFILLRIRLNAYFNRCKKYLWGNPQSIDDKNLFKIDLWSLYIWGKPESIHCKISRETKLCIHQFSSV